MSDALDRRIRTAVTELVESSPRPHPVGEMVDPAGRPGRPVTVSAGVVRLLATAAAVLAVALAGIWIGRSMSPPPGVADVPVVGGALGPEPASDAFDSSREVQLLPYDGSARPDVVPGTLRGEVVAAGRIEDTELQLFTWTSDDELDPRCVHVVGPRAAETVCSSGPESAMEPHSFARLDEGTGERIDVVVMWKVPDDTALVVADTGDESLHQRPRGGVAGFTFPADVPRVTLQAWDAQQESLATGGVFPRRESHPGASLDVAPEDLIELEADHPAVRLLDQGFTDRTSMATAAREQGVRDFSCGRGGVVLVWELCMFYHDGVLAIVPFGGEPGLVGRVVDPHLSRDAIVPLDSDDPVGLANTGLRPTVFIEYLGERIGSTSGAWTADADS